MSENLHPVIENSIKTFIPPRRAMAEINSDIKRLLRAIEDSPDLSDAYLEGLEALLGEHADKVDSYMYVIDSFKAIETMCDKKAEEWADIAAGYAKKAERVKERLEFHVRSSPGLSFKGENYEAKIVKNPPSLVLPSRTTFSTQNVIPPEFVHCVPESYRETRVLHTYRTDQIKGDLKQNKPVFFASLECKEKMVIKPRVENK